MPASILMKVVLPVPFCPSMTMISESVNSPASTLSLKPASDASHALYVGPAGKYVSRP